MKAVARYRATRDDLLRVSSESFAILPVFRKVEMFSYQNAQKKYLQDGTKISDGPVASTVTLPSGLKFFGLINGSSDCSLSSRSRLEPEANKYQTSSKSLSIEPTSVAISLKATKQHS